MPLANGEPVALIDALDQESDRLDGVTVHQMHALDDHPYLHGERRPNLTHRSCRSGSGPRP